MSLNKLESDSAHLDAYQKCVLSSLDAQPSQPKPAARPSLDPGKSYEKTSRWKRSQPPSQPQTASCPGTEAGGPQPSQARSSRPRKPNVLKIHAKEAFGRLFLSAKRTLSLDANHTPTHNTTRLKPQPRSASQSTLVISYPKKLNKPEFAFIASQDPWADENKTSGLRRHATTSGRPRRPARSAVDLQRSLTYNRRPLSTRLTQASSPSTKVASKTPPASLTNPPNHPTVSPTQVVFHALSTDRPPLNLCASLHESVSGATTIIPQQSVNIHKSLTRPVRSVIPSECLGHEKLVPAPQPALQLIENSEQVKPASLEPAPETTQPTQSDLTLESAQPMSPKPVPTPIPPILLRQSGQQDHLRKKSPVVKTYFEPIEEDITITLMGCRPSQTSSSNGSSFGSSYHPPSPRISNPDLPTPSTRPFPVSTMAPLPTSPHQASPDLLLTSLPPSAPSSPTSLLAQLNQAHSRPSSICTWKTLPFQSLVLTELDCVTESGGDGEDRSAWYMDLMTSIDRTIGNKI